MASSDPSSQAGQQAYCRDDVVLEISSLYKFLITMYLPGDAIRYPPPRGWPKVTKTRLGFLGKNDTVIDLLRHLPYPKNEGSHASDRHIGYEICDECVAIDYGGGTFQEDGTDFLGRPKDSAVTRKDKMSVEQEEDVPPHVATIARPSTKYGWWIWLDTNDGSVEMLLCVYGGTRRFDTVHAFCEFVKDQYRCLKMVPHSVRSVQQENLCGSPPTRVSEILTRHGWPSDAYNKCACMHEIENDDDIIG